MPNGLMNFALQMMMKNSNAQNTPMGREFMEILQTGDEQRGIQLANNLCQSYGDSRESAYNKALNYFQNHRF